MSAIVTEEALAKLRARLGTEVAIDTPPHLTEITRDGLRHWAYGIGDRNPLWLQGTVAPPSILFAFNRLAAGYTGGLPGVHALYAGSDYTFERWPRLGDQLEARAVFEELRERDGGEVLHLNCVPLALRRHATHPVDFDDGAMRRLADQRRALCKIFVSLPLLLGDLHRDDCFVRKALRAPHPPVGAVTEALD